MTSQYDDQTIEKSLDEYVAFVLAQAEYHYPPDDGRQNWQPEEFELAYQVLRESWPVRIPVEYEIFFDGERVQMLSRALTEALPSGLCLDVVAAPLDERGTAAPAEHCNHRRVVRALFPCDRDTLGNALALMARRAAQRGILDLTPLLLLIVAEPETVLPVATDCFADLLSAGKPDLPGPNALRYLVLMLVTRAPESLATLIERTSTFDRTAGRRLRQAFLASLGDPYVCDQLGWLETGRLIEELEEL